MFQGDVFLHKKEFEKGLKVGCEVQFYLMLNNRGRPQASRVTMVQEADSTKGVEGLLALAGLEQESTEVGGGVVLHEETRRERSDCRCICWCRRCGGCDYRFVTLVPRVRTAEPIRSMLQEHRSHS